MNSTGQPSAIQQAFSKLNGTLKTVFKKKNYRGESANSSAAATPTPTPAKQTPLPPIPVNANAQAEQQTQQTEQQQQQQIFSSPSAALAAESELAAAASGDYILYSRGYCPFTEQVRIAFAFKNRDLRFIKWAPNDTPPEWFATASPDKSVPVLQFPNGSFTNSSAEMITHLESMFPTPSLVPTVADGSLKDECTEWAKFIRTEFIPAFNKVLMGTNPAIQQEFRPKLKAAVAKISEKLVESSSSGPFLLGDAYMLPDLLLSPFLRRLEVIKYFRGVDFFAATNSEKIKEYVNVLGAQDWVQSVVAPIDEMKKFFVKTIPKMKPMSIGRLQHIAINAQYAKCVSLAESIQKEIDENKTVDVAAAESLRTKYSLIANLIEAHSWFEENLIYPIFEELKPGSSTRAHGEHEHEVPETNEFLQQLSSAVEKIGGDGESGFEGLVLKLKALAQSMKEHMDGEESELFPLTANLGEKEAPLFTKIYFHLSKSNESLLPFVLEPLSQQERMQYLYNIDQVIRGVDMEEWKRCQTIVKGMLSPADWEDLVFRLPSLEG
ncbi:hypothetical protein HK100_000715 [Physocladia obscura]|uniref:Uncharacterized protein n=1 Tax=Physocladia obscura TaxID=109957 RepID=A0AAD5XCD3_9FUNG|nr:hypothetical protein HK100_000715 [Physocladia obscura]